MNGYTVLVGLATFGGAVYLLKMKKQKPEIFRSHNRYLLYNGLLFFGAIVFAMAGLETRNNWLVLVFSILMSLMNYYGLAWSKVNHDIVCNISSTKRLLVRPGLAVVIGSALAYQFVAIAVLIGSGEFSTLNLARPEAAATNSWAWSYRIVGAGLTTGCTILFMLECLKTAASIVDTNTVNGLWHQYRVYAFAVINLLDAIFFGLMLLGDFSYIFSPDGSFEQGCTALRNQVLLLLCLAFLAQHFLDGKMFQGYVTWRQRRLARLTKELEWFYNSACQLFEVNYRLNPYKLKWNEAESTELSLNIVVNCLNETRKWLYREERNTIADETTNKFRFHERSELCEASIKSEAQMWLSYLTNSTQVAVRFNGRESRIVPPIKGANVEARARYYVKLSRKLLKLLKCQDTGVYNV